jgi:hypothetical protein
MKYSANTYSVTGQLNQHPGAATAARAGADRDNYVDFYDRLTADIEPRNYQTHRGMHATPVLLPLRRE